MKLLKHLLLFICCFILSIFLCMQVFDDILIRINISEMVYIIARIFLSLLLYLIAISIINKKLSKKHIDLIAILYIVCILSVTFLKGVNGSPSSGFNLNPLQIIEDFKLATNSPLLLIGNLFAYAPIGIYAKFRFNIDSKKIYLIFLLYCICIESLQYLLKFGSFDINDIILNYFGFIIGIILYKIATKNNKFSEEISKNIQE